MRQDGFLSVVIPAYNEEEMIAKIINEVESIIEKMGIRYEILFVDDGSSDKTWKYISSAAASDEHIRGISFSRNFGKEAAISAGIQGALGDCIVIMDCDMQHPPEIIPQMYKEWKKGADIVDGIKEERSKESFLKRQCVGFFYQLMSIAVGVDMSGSSDFKLIDRSVVEKLLIANEKMPFFRAGTSWIGFEHTEVKYKVADRLVGVSKWNIKSLILYAFNCFISYSNLPLLVSFVMSIFSIPIAFILSILFLTSIISTDLIVLFIFLYLVFISIQFGTASLYIAGIKNNIQNRPKWIISKKI